MLQSKKIIIGVCGGIAAYKITYLVRLFVKEGAEVKVIITPSAKEFITPLTLATLSKNPVLSSFSEDETGQWHNHVELGLWADVFIIAPATANTIAKCANGQCDNLLTAVYLSARCPVFFAPAMDLDMYIHPAVQHNIDQLMRYGNQMIGPEEGELASGLTGKGRMSEPENILQTIKEYFQDVPLLKNKKVLITAGPTYEALDPVRFIGNHSSGKMGFALAEAFSNYGAEVTLVSGPTNQELKDSQIKLIKVTSADEMYQAAKKNFKETNITVLAAAVADFKPKIASTQKIKKKDNGLTLELVKTVDIAAELGKAKSSNQFIVGFALETENGIENALNKIKNKNFDLIVLNSLTDVGAGFQHDTNKITILDKDNKVEKFELKSKKEVAKDIINAVIRRLK